MQNKDYENFTQEKTEEEIAVGVPVNIQPGQIPNPCFQQPYPYPTMNQQPQGFYPNQNVQFTNPNQQNIPMQGRHHHTQVVGPAQGTAFDYSKPVNIRCPCCSAQVTTVVNHETGNTTYLWAGIIFCCISPFCSCVPFLTNRCMDKNHYCPQCGFNIVRKHRGFFDCS